MPGDSRRLPVPEQSQSPYALLKTTSQTELVKPCGTRQDGRNADKVRPIFLKTGVVSQAKGSAYIELDQTKLLCAVYGPREVTRREEFSMNGQLLCEFKFATFSCHQRRSHQQDNQEKELSVILQETLEPAICLDKFPKSRMDVFVTVMQDDGSALAAAITAASLALAAAGVEMYDLVVGCAVRMFGGHMLLDPSANEEFHSKVTEDPKNNGTVTVGLMPSMYQISGLVQKGQLDATLAVEAIKLCVDAAQKIYPVVQDCLVRSVKRKLQQEGT